HNEGRYYGLVENNDVHHTTHGGFHQHYGKENIIRNNVFALSSGEQQIQRSREEDHLSFTFERNIVHWSNGSAMTLSGPTNVRFDHNIYSGISADAFRAGGKTWDAWRMAGEDHNSKMLDALTEEFQLKPDVAREIGFETIDTSTIGVRIR